MNVHGVDAAIASSLGGGGVSIARGPRVLFLVHHTRKTIQLVRAVNDTWCHGLRACVFFSDQRAKSDEAGLSAFITAPVALERLLNSYQIAQLRYLPALHAVRRRMLRDGGTGLLANVEWIVQADDDTFIFYHNLLRRLDSLTATSEALATNLTKSMGGHGPAAIYTGDVWPANRVPANADGWGRRMPVETRIPFAMGGGATILNRRALQLMDTTRCLRRSLRGGSWWLWQSDWVIGACAHAAGIPATPQPMGTFNQFACSARTLPYCEREESRYFDEPYVMPASCRQTHVTKDNKRALMYLDETCSDALSNCVALLDMGRCTIHPVRTASAIQQLWEVTPRSHSRPVRNLRLRQPDGTRSAKHGARKGQVLPDTLLYERKSDPMVELDGVVAGPLP